jgi:hypothetical protein
MRQSDQLGIRFNKSAIRRQLIAGPLSQRSNGSIEAKFMNCSAVAAQYGHQLVVGYKPAPHFQKSLGHWYSVANRIVNADTEQGIQTDMQAAIQVTV